MHKVLKGRVVTWNSEKSFGFIQPDNGSSQIFIHISDFKERGVPPAVGEVVFYTVATGKDGKKRAVNAYRNKKQSHEREKTEKKEYGKRGVLKKRYMLIIAIGVIVMLAGRFNSKDSATPAPQHTEYTEKQIYTNETEDMEKFHEETEDFIAKHTRQIHINVKKEKPKKAEQYWCDGRQYCSQMHSCEEATYFLEHCPDTKMDGDRDGIPCEGQWCGH